MHLNCRYIKSFARAIPGSEKLQNIKMQFLCFFQNQKLDIFDFGLSSLSGETFAFMQKSHILLILIIALPGCDLQNLKPSGNTSRDLSNIVELNKTAQVAYQNEDWKTAEIAYLKLTEKVPAEPEPWFRLGNIYARTENLDAAIVAYRKALFHDSKNSKIWHNLGVVQLRQATNTFIEMLEYTNEDDPLNRRAKNVIKSVSDLMASGFETVGKE